MRLEAFSDGVLAIAITLLILDVRVEQEPGESLAAALRHAGPEIAYAATFLQSGTMWLTLAATVALALVFLLGPPPAPPSRSAEPNRREGVTPPAAEG